MGVRMLAEVRMNMGGSSCKGDIAGGFWESFFVCTVGNRGLTARVGHSAESSTSRRRRERKWVCKRPTTEPTRRDIACRTTWIQMLFWTGKSLYYWMDDDGCDVIGKGPRPLRLWPVHLTFLCFCAFCLTSFRLRVWVQCVLWRVKWSRGVLCCFRRNLLSIWKRRVDFVVVDCIAFAMMFCRCQFTHQLYGWNKCLSSCLLLFFFLL